jgi:hypothetical protein
MVLSSMESENVLPETLNLLEHFEKCRYYVRLAVIFVLSCIQGSSRAGGEIQKRNLLAERSNNNSFQANYIVEYIKYILKFTRL